MWKTLFKIISGVLALFAFIANAIKSPSNWGIIMNWLPAYIKESWVQLFLGLLLFTYLFFLSYPYFKIWWNNKRKKAICIGADLIYEDDEYLKLNDVVLRWSKLEHSNFDYTDVLERLTNAWWKGVFGDPVKITDDGAFAEKETVTNLPLSDIFYHVRKISNGKIRDFDEIEEVFGNGLEIYDTENDTILEAYIKMTVITKVGFIKGIERTKIKIPDYWYEKTKE